MGLGRLRPGLESPEEDLDQREAAGVGAEARLGHLRSQINIAHGAFVYLSFNSVLNVKALVGALNQEKVLVGAFSVIVKSSRTFVFRLKL